MVMFGMYLHNKQQFSISFQNYGLWSLNTTLISPGTDGLTELQIEHLTLFQAVESMWCIEKQERLSHFEDYEKIQSVVACKK